MTGPHALDAGSGWLVVVDSPFLPARDGGQREHLGFVRAVHDHGLLGGLVVFTTDADHPVAPYGHEFPGAPVTVVRRRTDPTRAVRVAPYAVASRALPERSLAEIARRHPAPSAVVGFSFKVHRAARSVARRLGVPVLVRMHNVESDYVAALGRSTVGVRRILLALESRRTRREERALERRAGINGIADISAVDAASRSARATVPVVHVPPFATYPLPPRRPRRTGPVQTSRVLYVGALDVLPNLHALRWFLSAVWPSVVDRCPGTRLVVAGRAPDAATVRWLSGHHDVVLEPSLADLAPALDSADVAVNPALLGSGVNIKLLDYLVHEVPAVSTARSCQAIGLRHGDHVLVGDEPSAFADAVVSTLRDLPAARRRAEAARRFVEDGSLSASTSLETMQELVRDTRTE